MHFEVEELSSTEKRFQIVIPASRVDAAFSRAYAEISAHGSMPGFRAGHVPMAHLKKRFGAQAMARATDELAMLAWKEISKTDNFRPVGEPDFDFKPAAPGKDFPLTIKLYCVPEFELRDPKEIELEHVDWQICDQAVEDEVMNLRKRFGNLREIEDAEVVATTDHVAEIDYTGTIYDVAFPGGASEGDNVPLGEHNFIDGFEAQILGHKAGDKFDINVTFPEDYPQKNLAGKPAVFATTLKKLKVLELAGDDVELAKKVGARDMAQVRDSIRDELKRRYSQGTDEELQLAIREKMGELYDFPVPEPMITAQVEEARRARVRKLAQEGKSVEEADKEAAAAHDEFVAQATKEARAEMVIEAFAAREKIDASEQEVQRAIIQLSNAMGKYGNTLRSIYEDPQHRANFRRRMRQEKVLNYLQGQITLKQVPRDAPYGKTETEGGEA